MWIASSYWALIARFDVIRSKMVEIDHLKVNSINCSDTEIIRKWWHLKSLLLYCCVLKVR